jgi:ribonuclease P protein component
LNHEKNISTRSTETCAQARFSSAHEDQGGSANYQGAARARPGAPVFLTVASVREENASAKFRRDDRLHDSADFSQTLRAGQRCDTAYFSIYFRNTRHGFARLGIAVGRRVTRKATRRNRIKRSLREAFRRQASALPSIDVVVLAKPACGMLSNVLLNEAAGAFITELKGR